MKYTTSNAVAMVTKIALANPESRIPPFLFFYSEQM